MVNTIGSWHEPGVENDRDYTDASRFLVHEAFLLDENRLEEWVAVLDPDIRYIMPVRLTLSRAELDKTASPDYHHFDDDYELLQIRVARAQQEWGFSESPPSRVRRFVTNLTVTRHEGDADLHVRSYLLVMRNRLADTNYEMISAMRNDILRPTEDGKLRLLRREILIDQAVLGVVNLAIFL